MADAVGPILEDKNKHAVDGIEDEQSRGPRAIIAHDPVGLRSQGPGVGVDAANAMVREGDTARVAAKVGQLYLESSDGRSALDDPASCNDATHSPMVRRPPL